MNPRLLCGIMISTKYSQNEALRQLKFAFAERIKRIFSEFSLFIWCALLFLFSTFYQVYIKFLYTFQRSEEKIQLQSAKLTLWSYGMILWDLQIRNFFCRI